MSNVIDFPSAEVRNWTAWERFISDIVRRAGNSESVAKHLQSRLRPLFDLLNEEIRSSVEVPESSLVAVEQTREALYSMVAERDNKILLERLKREIDLYLDHGFL